MDEVKPPWVMYPGYPPMDTFWRQSGEAWFYYVWEQYWKSLSEDERERYLKKWDVPSDWRHLYFEAD